MDPLNPVAVENRIRSLSNEIARGVGIVTERLKKFKQAERAFDEAFSRAYLNAAGSVEDRKRQAMLETMSQREALDFAEVEFKHADRRAKALELELRGIQSIGASVRAMYGVAGRGE